MRKPRIMIRTAKTNRSSNPRLSLRGGRRFCSSNRYKSTMWYTIIKPRSLQVAQSVNASLGRIRWSHSTSDSDKWPIVLLTAVRRSGPETTGFCGSVANRRRAIRTAPFTSKSHSNLNPPPSRDDRETNLTLSSSLFSATSLSSGLSAIVVGLYSQPNLTAGRSCT